MDLQLLPIITFFSVLFVASHGALSPEAYWNSVLPNTAMPKAVKDLLSPEKSTSVSVGKGGLHVNTGKGGTNVNVGHGSVSVHTGKGTNVNVGHGSVGVHTGKGTNVGVGKGGVGVQTGKGINHNYAASMAQPQYTIRYYYAASMARVQDSKNRAVFFLEKDLVPGNSMSLKFPKTDRDATFLARSDAKKIPFSSNKMSEVFELYDVIAESEEGQAMTETVNECEKPTVKGEEKFCATSLESIVDFSTSKLGKNVKAISTEVDKETKLQKYAITGVSKMNGNEAAVCHKLPYPYAVFYCHYTHTTRAYAVSLTGANGTKANALVACHTDMSTWNPRHLASQVLQVQPGTVSVCHYLPQDNIVWVANLSTISVSGDMKK